MHGPRKLPDLVEAIYDAGLDPSLWNNVVTGIRDFVGGQACGLFSKDSIRLLAVSYLLTLPLIWMAVQSWLSNFAFHIGMEWIIFFVPPVCLIVVSLTTVVVIALKTALLSPAVSLRSE